MSVVYQCRHCNREIGTLDLQVVNYSMLGIDQLSAEERQKMIHYDPDGSLRIQSICDSCKNTLKEHPEYHELDYFIQ